MMTCTWSSASTDPTEAAAVFVGLGTAQLTAARWLHRQLSARDDLAHELVGLQAGLDQLSAVVRQGDLLLRRITVSADAGDVG